MKIIQILHPRYHPKIIGRTLKKQQQNEHICIHEIIQIIIMKIGKKRKHRSHIDHIRYKQRSHIDHTRYKHRSHIDHIRYKQT